MNEISENSSLKGENSSLKGENSSLKGENESLKGENESLKGENESLKGENESLKGQIESLKGENESLNSENESLNTLLSKYAEEYLADCEEMDRLSEAIDNLYYDRKAFEDGARKLIAQLNNKIDCNLELAKTLLEELYAMYYKQLINSGIYGEAL